MTDRTQTALGPDELSGVDIPVAAERLRISTDAVRKRLARGQLPGIKREGRWYVLLNGTDSPAGPDRTADWTSPEPRPDSDRTGTGATGPVQDMDRLERENAWLRARLEAAEVERAELRRLLAGALQKIEQLPSPAPPAESAAERSVVPASSGEGRTKGEQPDDDDRLGLHQVAHELEKRRPWWWLRDWRRREREKGKG